MKKLFTLKFFKSDKEKSRSGQTMIFLIMILVCLIIVVMLNFDVHKIIHSKTVTQNAGDAAALMAARWQGITLNLEGELNVMHALAMINDDTDTIDAISNIQARISYVGPMIAFMAAQQAAKNNGIYVNEDFTDRIREHADKVRYVYPTEPDNNGNPLFPEPWPGAWPEYADMLDTVADNGIAAAPDNQHLYADYTFGHPLIDIGFYEAIAGKNWCWFIHNYANYNVANTDPSTTLLEGYKNYPPTWWPPLPAIPHQQYINSETFGLGLNKYTTTFDSFATSYNAAGLSDANINTASSIINQTATWYGYSADAWDVWDSMDVHGSRNFPVVGTVRPQYDYTGADAVIRINADITRITPGSKGSEVPQQITWTAAAKPFGMLNEADRPNAFQIILPAFKDVRLIPISASSTPSGGAFNIPWRVHIENHLEPYLAEGPHGLSQDCWYCAQLNSTAGKWEDAAFRKTGADWLAIPENENLCHTQSGPGGPGGGTRVAH